MITQIKKRYGSVVGFDKSKITNAVYRAAREGGGESREECDRIADKVVEKVEKEMPKGTIPTVEGVQDVVEQVLIETGHAKTAKAYIIYRQRRAEIRKEKQIVLEKDEIDEVDKKFDVNALRVLKARYLRKDDQGRLIETPKQLFTRVAVHTALPDLFYDERIFDKSGGEQHPHEDFEPELYDGEFAIGRHVLNRYHLDAIKRMYDRFNRQGNMKVSWNEFLEMLKNGDFNKYENTADDFYNIMVNRQFMPNTPAIANFGSVLGMGSACFHPDQLVITKDGTKRICDVQVGDEVLTHKGRFRKVKEVFIRETDSVLSFECRKLPKPSLLVTDEHPILAFKDGEVNWYPAYMIREGDHVALSYPTETKDVEKIKVSDLVEGVNVEGNLCSYQYSGGKFNAFVHTTKSVENVVDVDYDLMKVFGFYLAEGNVSESDCVRFTLSSDELNYCKEIISIIENKFGVTARVETNKDPERKWLSLRFHSTILAKFFENLFGTGYNKKKMPAWIMTLPMEKQKGLMSGMIRGDGTVFKNWNKMNARLVMSNTNLVYAFWQMCMRCGVFAALGRESMSKLGRVQSLRCTLGNSKGQLLMNELFGKILQETVGEDKTMVINGVVFTEIENIEKIDYTGPVYNLEVEEDHSYVANMVSVHNCYVLGIDDDLTSIMDTLKHTALIHQAGGGTGFNFSKLRPEGDIVKSTCGAASGPISFMKLYDNMTDVIKQGGMRRGANMGILNSNHPDIEKFITAKEGNKALRNFNISVLIMGDFWDYYEKDEPYPLINPRNGQVERTVSPRMLFDKIVYQAWESAEPGVIFFDKVNEFNPFLEHLGPIVTTNPCVAGDTKILTEDGWIEIEKLAEMEDVPKLLVDARTLASGERQMQAGLLAVKAVRIWKTGEKETLVLTMESGKELTATPDHRILTRNGWKAVSEIIQSEKVFVQDGSGEATEEKVISITKGKLTAVYDITEPLTHSFIANGIIVHNCGEVLLYPNEPCNLGSVNVWAFAKEDENGSVFIDWDEMARVTNIATHFLDNVIDVNKWPLQQIEDMALATRKIGLGIMGVGDLLFELGLPYNNDDGRAFMEQLMEFVNYWTKVQSVELAKERGSLPYYDKSFYPKGNLPFRGSPLKHFDWDEISEQVRKHGIRNGYTTIIAPTGSISMIAGCSSGIEPVYSLVFEKNVKVGSFFYIDPVFEKVMKREGLYDEDLMKEIAENRGSIQNIPYIPQKLKRIFVTAMDATPESHIRALAAFQKWVDSSISKTNNFPANATVEDMRQSYLLAYQLGCKDVTVFRDSSIKEQVLVAPSKEKVQEVKKERYVMQQAVKETLTETSTGTLLQHQTKTNGKMQYKECPTCSSVALSFKEGCLTCESCGWGLCA